MSGLALQRYLRCESQFAFRIRNIGTVIFRLNPLRMPWPSPSNAVIRLRMEKSER